jgi:hypothetical protein
VTLPLSSRRIYAALDHVDPLLYGGTHALPDDGGSRWMFG